MSVCSKPKIECSSLISKTGTCLSPFDVRKNDVWFLIMSNSANLVSGVLFLNFLMVEVFLFEVKKGRLGFSKYIKLATLQIWLFPRDLLWKTLLFSCQWNLTALLPGFFGSYYLMSLCLKLRKKVKEINQPLTKAYFVTILAYWEKELANWFLKAKGSWICELCKNISIRIKRSTIEIYKEMS